jgi:hypothetical protein
MGINYVSSAIVSHYVGISPCPSRRIVNGTSLVAKKSAVVVLMDHHLILFNNAINFYYSI